MAFPRIAFVASPDVGSAVLYEFNLDKDVQVAHAGFDLGAPEWLGGDPRSRTGAYDFRTVQFTHWVSGDDAAAVTELNTLGQLLAAPYQWLLVQLRSGAEARWLKVWRSSPRPLSWDDIRLSSTVRGRYGIDLSLTADPFLLGPNTTVASSQTVNNDPAAGSNPNRLALSTVVGDVAAPAVVSVTPNARQDGALRFLAITPGSATQTVYQVGASDGWTVTAPGPFTATSNANWSAGSYRTSNVSVGNLDQLTATKTVQPGRYMVLVRAGQSSGATAVWEFRFWSALTLNLPIVITVQPIAGASNEAQWHPMGITTFPVASSLSAAALAAEPTFSSDIGLMVRKMSGTGDLNVDAIVLIPVADDWTSLKFVQYAGYETAVTTDIVDGEQELIYCRNSADSKLAARPTVAMGGFPMLTPGSNVLHLYGATIGAQSVGIALAGSVANRADTISTTHTVTVTYRPRWLWPSS